MSGAGMAVDSNGAMFVATGNGDFDQAKSNYSDSLLKLVVDTTTSSTNQNSNGWGLTVEDFFTPLNQATLQANDKDLGSGGVMILPDSAGSATAPHLILLAGKLGTIFLVNRDNMGGFDSATDHVVQEQVKAINGAWSSPAFFGSSFYYVTDAFNATTNNQAKAFSIVNGQFSTTPTSISSDTYTYPGSTPTVSANGATNGIVWTLDRTSNTLNAYDATNLANELYTSALAPNVETHLARSTHSQCRRWQMASVRRHRDRSRSYGLLNPQTAPSAPTGLTATANSTSQINLTWTDNANNETGYLVEQSSNGSSFTQVASLDANLTAYSATGRRQARRTHSGSAPPIAQVTRRIPTRRARQLIRS